MVQNPQFASQSRTWPLFFRVGVQLRGRSDACGCQATEESRRARLASRLISVTRLDVDTYLNVCSGHSPLRINCVEILLFYFLLNYFVWHTFVVPPRFGFLLNVLISFVCSIHVGDIIAYFYCGILKLFLP